MRAHGEEVLAEEVRVPTVAGSFGAQAGGVVVPARAAFTDDLVGDPSVVVDADEVAIDGVTAPRTPGLALPVVDVDDLAAEQAADRVLAAVGTSPGAA